MCIVRGKLFKRYLSWKSIDLVSSSSFAIQNIELWIIHIITLSLIFLIWSYANFIMWQVDDPGLVPKIHFLVCFQLSQVPELGRVTVKQQPYCSHARWVGASYQAAHIYLGVGSTCWHETVVSPDVPLSSLRSLFSFSTFWAGCVFTSVW